MADQVASHLPHHLQLALPLIWWYLVVNNRDNCHLCLKFEVYKVGSNLGLPTLEFCYLLLLESNDLDLVRDTGGFPI